MPNVLVIAEHDQGQLKLATLSAAAFAQKLCAAAGGSFEILVTGENIGGISESLRHYGAANVLVADHARLRAALADRYAQVIVETVRQRGATMVVAAVSPSARTFFRGPRRCSMPAC